MSVQHTSDDDRLAELRGLIQGVIADGEVNLREFAKLDRWLADNPSIANRYPADAIRRQIDSISADQVVDPHELQALHDLLEKTAENR